MNPTAIFFGLFYGIVSAVVFYVVSMLTSGLFARPFYRLYARVLIGICCVMMLAPPLRWLASLSPSWGFVSLTLAQYLAVGILMWGVFRFNRDFMQQIFLKRATVAYFTFGTLANALLVTLAFLQVAVSGAPTWGVLNGDRAYLTLGHYGPILLLLAAMVLHTDYRLKVCKGTPLHFSRFSFVGYALSFLGIALSMLPYLGQAITVLGLSTGEWQLLQNASCAQSLLIAIVVFAWLVWRYESIPPLFVLLLAIVFEYHVVFTQWAIRWWGVESWGLATLPLLFAMAGLYRYFSHWDERKRRSRNEGQSDQGTSRVQEESLRFVLPFQVVYGLLGIGLLSVTLWARLAPGQLTSPLWAGATFGIYAIYFYGEAFFRRDVKLIYAAGLLAILAALLGFERPGFAESVITLGFLAFAWGMIALAGERLGLKRAWRTAMIDGSFVAAFMVVGLVFLRHLGTNQPYYFAAVSWQDGLACLCAAGAFAACAHQYRSRLPVFAGLFALAIIAPMLSAGLALLITLLTLTAERRLPKDNAITFEDRLLFLNRISLPWTEKLPEVLIHGLSVGAIPLALIGLVVSLWHMLRWNLSPLTLLGLATASLALGLLTHRRRSPWLLVASLLSGYLTLHATLQAYWLGQSSLAETIAAHLLVASGISLLLWLVAGGNAWWCDQLLMRVAEEREPAIRDRKAFYSGWLQRIAILTNLCVFLLMAAASFWLLVDSFDGWTAGLALATLVLLAMFFIHVDQVYRNQVGSYLALSSIGLAILWSSDQWGSELANGGSWSRTVLYAAASMMAGLLAAILYGWRSAKADEPKVELARSLAVLQFPGRRPIAGWDLWHRPLAVAAICFGLASLIPHVLISGFSPFELANLPVTCVACALSSFGFLFSTRSLRFSTVYVGGIGLAYLAAHCGLQSMFLQGQQGPHLLALHLLLGSLLCAASAVLASLTAAWLNGSRGSRTSAIKVASRFADARDFYCGVLHHVALVFAGGLLVCGWILAQTRLDGNSAFGFLLPCSALVVYFAFSGACYRS
ncbi:MAG: hypothetical protein NXI32_26540, partial [bacterium]|nr:hypothetical protein [bacterium]